MNEPVDTPRRNLTGAVVPAVAVAALAAVGAILMVGANGNEKAKAAAGPTNCILENADGVGGAIDLVDGNGAHVTQADFAGEPVVLYFGFTHCPDVCPNTMYALAEALALPGGYDVQTALISLDPERDTPQVMEAYAATDGFPEGLVGLTGTRAQVDAAKRAFQVYSARVEIPGAPAGVYNVDHSSFIYVLNGQWQTVAIAPTMRRQNATDPRSPMAAVAPQELAACIAAGLERG
jgi:protein SCO1/2